jgi:hypothetical protein
LRSDDPATSPRLDATGPKIARLRSRRHEEHRLLLCSVHNSSSLGLLQARRNKMLTLARPFAPKAWSSLSRLPRSCSLGQIRQPCLCSPACL